MSGYYDDDEDEDYYVAGGHDDWEPEPCNGCGAPHYGEHYRRCPLAPIPKTILQRLRRAWFDRFYYRRILLPSIYDLDMKLRRSRRKLSRPQPPTLDDDIPF
ncbi:hypothetical protein EOB36_20345 [Mesorhizobium sp. M6A.T.Cr.TU.017.01.1.1]|uniref:hypothetical protein n=1 Tax=Mesorhizobium sp. M6A.T.Cr.TU.017.01.1.1 TaxID=2496774 RepID=UPI000FD35D01|nr:hypothetical protein [Mesorhizobium sp. M6A.T.Cr.TU.017.01.1.1]RUU99429.1 hypothetical protein EOB36_20345 [Mesorhizobium sp. M6A.T.Cr.TU.017.01.1.1]